MHSMPQRRRYLAKTSEGERPRWLVTKMWIFLGSVSSQEPFTTTTLRLPGIPFNLVTKPVVAIFDIRDKSRTRYIKND